ncbi:hypothetical protein JTE90_029051 [Oedothorax gibbosus]|uniref:CRAL-TRIO domain-containing protein n=1 Tax=Oedothorax gibbosus TaxID=931172 RepID=A0AAV6UWQ5_9ARAC|nr:hypothetical protein JTE90_029051 [Oedothorax gibbosus]
MNVEEIINLPVDFEGETLQLKNKAENELNETEENIRNGLKVIKELVKEEGTITCFSDDFILLFLRVNKFDFKKTFKRLKEYSHLRHQYMNYYGFMIPENILPVFTGGICGILPYRDNQGRAIIYFRANQIAYQLEAKMDTDDVLRAVQVLAHFVLMFPATQISGFCIIADMKVDSIDVLQLVFKYVRYVLPTIHLFPARIQKVDCINTNVIVRTLINLVRPLIPNKIFKRTSFHGSDIQDLLKVYDASLLPEEFGGTLGPVKQLSEQYLPKFKEYIDVLQASNRYFTRKDTISYPLSNKELCGFFK